MGVAHKMIDIYGVVAGESDLVDELFKKLKHQVGLECRAQKGLMLLVGQIDSIIVNVIVALITMMMILVSFVVASWLYY